MVPSSLSVGTVPVPTPVQTTFDKYIHQGASMVKNFSSEPSLQNNKPSSQFYYTILVC